MAGTMYFADTPTRAIRAFDLDPATGALDGEREFASFPPFRGLPDGATVDAAGGLWVVHWEGWRVSRFLPDGTPDRSIRLPVPRPTCCAFGGDDLGTLFITSARTGLDAEILAGAPLSGGLFSLRPAWPGCRSRAFGRRRKAGFPSLSGVYGAGLLNWRGISRELSTATRRSAPRRRPDRPIWRSGRCDVKCPMFIPLTN